MDDRCRVAAELGCTGFDLVGPKDWPTLKKYGLEPTMYSPPTSLEPRSLVLCWESKVLDEFLERHLQF